MPEDPSVRAPDARHPVDVHVGRQLRLLRKAAGLSQAALADRLGVTPQQVQKYERGGNRISASKLYDAAVTLGAPVAVLFRGLPSAESDAETPPGVLRIADDLLAADDGFALADGFLKIGAPDVRHAIARLVTAMAKAAPGDPPDRQQE